VVTDKTGRAVTGLPREDFQVFEDGKPQAITFFEQHAGASVGGAPNQLAPSLPPDTFTNIPAAVPADSVNVLLLDALNTTLEDQMWVHKEMVKYLAAIPPGTRIAIFLLGNRLRILQGFTEDSSLLSSAIAHNDAGPEMTALPAVGGANNLTASGSSSSAVGGSSGIGGFMNRGQQVQQEANLRTEVTLEALQEIARYLAGVPGRKNLIWFSSEIPILVSACVSGPGNDACTSTSNPKGESPYYEMSKKTENMLANAQVAIYPIEATGLAPDSINDATGPPATAKIWAEGPIKFQTNTLRDGATLRNINHLTMDKVARDTGGTAIYNLNDLKIAIADDIDNGARYYTIAYTPKNRSVKGKERKIEVKLAPGNYNLAYRRSYFEDTPKEQKAEEAAQAKDPLRPLMDRGMPNFTELRYQTRILPIHPQPAADASRAGNNSAMKAPFTRYGIDFTLATDGLTLDAGPDGVRRGKIEVALVAYSRDGVPLNWMVHFMGLAVRPDQYEIAQKSGIPFHLDLDIPAGEVYLRTGIFDTSSNKAGTLEIPLIAVTSGGLSRSERP
jgi:VWFA-related protein